MTRNRTGKGKGKGNRRSLRDDNKGTGTATKWTGDSKGAMRGFFASLRMTALVGPGSMVRRLGLGALQGWGVWVGRGFGGVFFGVRVRRWG